MELTDCKWRALVVEVGAMGSLTGISSIVASVIAPLANCGVSVFCLSTNLDDFVLVSGPMVVMSVCVYPHKLLSRLETRWILLGRGFRVWLYKVLVVGVYPS